MCAMFYASWEVIWYCHVDAEYIPEPIGSCRPFKTLQRIAQWVWLGPPRDHCKIWMSRTLSISWRLAAGLTRKIWTGLCAVFAVAHWVHAIKNFRKWKACACKWRAPTSQLDPPSHFSFDSRKQLQYETKYDWEMCGNRRISREESTITLCLKKYWVVVALMDSLHG